MINEIEFSNEVEKYLEKLYKKNPQLFEKIKKRLKLFKENAQHPSLRTHKLKGHLLDSYSISIESNLRMVYYLKEDKVVFYSIGNHDEVYRK